MTAHQHIHGATAHRNRVQRIRAVTLLRECSNHGFNLRSHSVGARLDAQSWRRPSVIEPPSSPNRQQPDRPLQAYDRD